MNNNYNKYIFIYIINKRMNTILELLSNYDLNLNFNLLLITNKEFLKYKKEFYIYNLNNKMSIKYYEDINFRNKITASDRMLNLNKQLKLNLSRCYKITDVSELGNVHTLFLIDCDNITDISALGNVHTLNLYNCNKITDISALCNVHTLILSNCYNLTNVSALGNVY
jgi:hypothetical protein